MGNLSWRDALEVKYENDKVEGYCTGKARAKKLFGGDEGLAIKLLSRINALREALTLKDIIEQKQFRFHNLRKIGGRDLRGSYAIDVKTRKEPWRIVLVPLDDNENPTGDQEIHNIAMKVRIIKIMEVSNHYE